MRFEIIRKLLVGILISVIPFILTAFGETKNAYAASAAGSLKDSRWVFIGDSWMADRKYGDFTGSVPDYIAKRLKLSHYQKYCRGKYGIARDGLNYKELIKDNEVDKEVTDVLIYGAIYNDRKCSHSKITESVDSLILLVKEKYPDARIWYTSMSWCCSEIQAGEKYRKRMLTRFPWYESAMEENGVKVITGITDAMAGLGPEYFTPDFHHPSKKGLKYVAKVLSGKIKKLY